MPIIRNFNHLAPSAMPVVTCAYCGRVMRAEWQPVLSSGLWQVTCDSAPEVCDVAGYTLSAENYPPANMNDYLATGRQRRMKLLAAAAAGMR